MAASAPYMQQCNSCENPVDEYTDDFLRFVETNYGDVQDCRRFLTIDKQNPNINFNQCMLCLSLKWRKLKYENSKPKGLTREKTFQYNQKLKFETKFWYRLAVIAVIMLIVGICTAYFSTPTESNAISDDTLKFTVMKLKKQFPSLQQQLLKKINAAFSRLKTHDEPFVFLLLHDDKNKKTTDCLASFTSSVAKQNIFTNTTKSLWMNASEWVQYSNPDDLDLFYEKLMTPLRDNRVLVLENLQDLPWSLTTALHHLCDSENPQIARAMYILELKVDGGGLPELADVDKLVTAERAMTTAWLEAPDANRAALISRLTSYVDAVLLDSDDECSGNVPEPQSEGSFVRISPPPERSQPALTGFGE